MPTRSTITFEESVVERKESAATVLGAMKISGHLPPNTPPCRLNFHAPRWSQVWCVESSLSFLSFHVSSTCNPYPGRDWTQGAWWNAAIKDRGGIGRWFSYEDDAAWRTVGRNRRNGISCHPGSFTPYPWRAHVEHGDSRDQTHMHARVMFKVDVTQYVPLIRYGAMPITRSLLIN